MHTLLASDDPTASATFGDGIVILMDVGKLSAAARKMVPYRKIVGLASDATCKSLREVRLNFFSLQICFKARLSYEDASALQPAGAPRKIFLDLHLLFLCGNKLG